MSLRASKSSLPNIFPLTLVAPKICPEISASPLIPQGRRAGERSVPSVYLPEFYLPMSAHQGQRHAVRLAGSKKPPPLFLSQSLARGSH